MVGKIDGWYEEYLTECGIDSKQTRFRHLIAFSFHQNGIEFRGSPRSNRNL